MKTFNKEDVFSFLNAKQAEKYIGTNCYFGYCYDDLQKSIDHGVTGELNTILTGHDDPVDSVFRTTNEIECLFGRVTEYFGLCLPCELVKKEEPKYRPFKSIEEFKSVVGDIGNVICFKPMNCNAKYSVMFSGVLEEEFGRINVLIGGMPHDFAELFEEYVLIKDGKEVPFGIKD